MSNQIDEQSAHALVEAARPFEEWYTNLQENFTVHCDPTDETVRLVDGLVNRTLPIHRWYTLKEAYSAALPAWACLWMKERYDHVACDLLDPFIGGGTSGVSLATSGVRITGVEYNPFIFRVAASKANVTQVPSRELAQTIALLENKPWRPSKKPLPELTTLHNRTYSKEGDVRLLMAAYDQVEAVCSSSTLGQLLHIGIAAAVESVFALRKDGRALRYVPSENMGSIRVRKVLSGYWRAMLHDIETFNSEQGFGVSKQESGPLFEVYQGSALDLTMLNGSGGRAKRLDDAMFDTILYSPPYLNNFDYSEIYKLELWLLRFVENYQDWRNLRLGTVQSHHSVKFPSTEDLARDRKMDEISKQIHKMSQSECLSNGTENDAGYEHMRPVIQGYFDHMYQALKEQWRVLKPGGILTYVVANSRHHYLPVATDVVLGEIARRIGFKPLDLVVLRQRNGRTRQKLFLRESAVFLRKPER